MSDKICTSLLVGNFIAIGVAILYSFATVLAGIF